MKYNPALDGVRAIAAIAVIAFHTGLPGFRGGFLGVDVFFVLSGFLITSIVRGELAREGALNLKRFYWRRMLRLMPPLMVALLGTVALWRIFRPSVNLLPDVIVSLLYVSDYGRAFGIAPDYLGHTWSLSVEARFYLLWPLFLIAFRRLPTPTLFRVVAVLFGIATLWQAIDLIVWRDFHWTYYRFDTRLSGIFLGAAVALRSAQITAARADRLAKASLFLLAACGATISWGALAPLLVGGLAAELATAVLLIALTSQHKTWVGSALAHPALVHLGVLSYSIYLWHYGVALLVREEFSPVVSFTVTLAASFVLAQMTYTLVEAPMRRWAHRRPKAAVDAA